MRRLIERLLARLGYAPTAPVQMSQWSVQQAAFEFGMREAKILHTAELQIQDARRESYSAGYAEGQLAANRAILPDTFDTIRVLH